jgi:hypothetical protein
MEWAEPGGELRFALGLGDQHRISPDQTPEHRPITYHEVFEAHRISPSPRPGGGRDTRGPGQRGRRPQFPHDGGPVLEPMPLPELEQVRKERGGARVLQHLVARPAEQSRLKAFGLHSRQHGCWDGRPYELPGELERQIDIRGDAPLLRPAHEGGPVEEGGRMTAAISQKLNSRKFSRPFCGGASAW